MQHSQTHLRTRPISAGHLRAFEAVARHLNFRAAAEEMALTQSAVSRQIQSLEEEVGVSLFLRHTRAVELTSAGAQLLMAVSQSLPRIDNAVRQIRQSAGRRAVSLTTFASFASMWLIPRLEKFQRENPEIDIRIDASDNTLDLEIADVDLALRELLTVPGDDRVGQALGAGDAAPGQGTDRDSPTPYGARHGRDADQSSGCFPHRGRRGRGGHCPCGESSVVEWEAADHDRWRRLFSGTGDSSSAESALLTEARSCLRRP